MNRAAFFDAIRDHVTLTAENVPGFGKVIDYGAARGTPLDDLAYVLATAYWESNKTMRPVEEAYWLSEAWRKAHLRYYPWHGRGLIQTTWKANYDAMGRELGVSLIAHPEYLLEWRYALPALFVGMEKGLYTGKALDDYIDGIDEPDDEDLREYVAARRIVNGTDKAATIGRIALRMEKGLRAAGYRPAGSAQDGETPPAKGNDTPEPASGLAGLLGRLLAIFAGWLAARLRKPKESAP